MAGRGLLQLLSPNITSKVSRQDEILMNWPFNLESYAPALTFGNDAVIKFSEFENSQLSKYTAVKCLRYFEDHSVHEIVLTKDLEKELQLNDAQYVHELFFINRFIIRPDTQDRPKDIKRLRISKLALRRLISHYEVPPTFLTSMLGDSLASLPFHHRRITVQKRNILDFWYILPIRVEVECTESAKSHILSPAGSNQMNPSQYLHLSDVGRDIRPSKLAVYFQHDEESHHTTTICIDFQDGRWWELAEEPFFRTKEVLQQARERKSLESPFFIHLLLLTSVSQWWRCTLLRFEEQLVAYAKQLQKQMYHPNSMPVDFINETNKALHTMVAHLHRYKTETDLLEEINICLSKHCRCSCTNNTSTEVPVLSPSAAHPNPNSPSPLLWDSYLEVIASEFKSLRIFVSELESKTQTTLGILFNNIRMANDKLLVANGESMRKIMKATSVEARLSRKMAKQSQEMAVGMRKDSISMKTIAILTMFFLPGTSYAAILSMPFFSQHPWIANIDRAWLWVTLTIPSTAIAFATYYFFARRGKKQVVADAEREAEREDGDVELDVIEEHDEEV